ncbi:MAG TPA: peptidoglycan-binding protein, partial [Planctomycetota bacterium]|nr:peptidoglycan-binding protein [Planctomycetota bacterium]
AKDPAKDTYKPLFNGGKDALPKAFYRAHNSIGGETKLDKAIKAGGGFGSVESLIYFGLAYEVDPSEMRRGDMVGIDWNSGGGHATFCWDVHLRDDGGKLVVDAFQYFSSNGSKKNGVCSGYGVSVGGGTKFIDKQKDSTYKKLAPCFTRAGGYDEYVELAHWNLLPKYTVESMKPFLATFKKKPRVLNGSTAAKKNLYAPGHVRVARFWGVTPPEPYGYVGGGNTAAAPAPAAPEPHATAKPEVIEVKPPAPKPDAKPKEVEQKKDKPTAFQKEVEELLQDLWQVKWIDKDPGTPDAVADPQSQAAIKDFQEKLGLEATGYADRKTRDQLRKAVSWSKLQGDVEEGLKELYVRGVLKTDPGPPDAVNDEQSRSVVKEFQGKYGLEQDGLAGPATRAKLKQVLAETAGELANAQSSGKGGAMAEAMANAAGGAAQGGAAAAPQLLFSTNFAKAGQQIDVRLLAPGALEGDIPEYPVVFIEQPGGKQHPAVRMDDGPNDIQSGDLLQI